MSAGVEGGAVLTMGNPQALENGLIKQHARETTELRVP